MTLQHPGVKHRHRHPTPGIPSAVDRIRPGQLDAFVHHWWYRYIERDCLYVAVALQRQNVAAFDVGYDDWHDFKCFCFGDASALATHKGVLLGADVVAPLGAL